MYSNDEHLGCFYVLLLQTVLFLDIYGQKQTNRQTSKQPNLDLSLTHTKISKIDHGIYVKHKIIKLL